MDSKIVTCPHCGRKNRLPAAADSVPRSAVPTLMLLRDGRVVARRAGAAPAQVLREWVDGALRGDS
jgi:thioredoxin 2